MRLLCEGQDGWSAFSRAHTMELFRQQHAASRHGAKHRMPATSCNMALIRLANRNGCLTDKQRLKRPARAVMQLTSLSPSRSLL